MGAQVLSHYNSDQDTARELMNSAPLMDLSKVWGCQAGGSQFTASTSAAPFSQVSCTVMMIMTLVRLAGEACFVSAVVMNASHEYLHPLTSVATLGWMGGSLTNSPVELEK